MAMEPSMPHEYLATTVAGRFAIAVADVLTRITLTQLEKTCKKKNHRAQCLWDVTPRQRASGRSPQGTDRPTVPSNLFEPP